MSGEAKASLPEGSTQKPGLQPRQKMDPVWYQESFFTLTPNYTTDYRGILYFPTYQVATVFSPPLEGAENTEKTTD